MTLEKNDASDKDDRSALARRLNAALLIASGRLGDDTGELPQSGFYSVLGISGTQAE